MVIGITLLGVGQTKVATSVYLDFNENLVIGDYVIVVAAAESAITAVYKYAGSSQVEDFVKDVEANNTGSVVSSIWSARCYNAGTLTRLQVYNAYNEPKVITGYLVTGLADSLFDKSGSGTGSGTTPSSGATAALSQADELVIGAIGVEDEIDDMTGTWVTGAGNVSGNEQGTGTNGGGDSSNIYIESAAEIVSATTAQTAAMTGIDSTDWATCIATYKGEAAVDPPTVTTQAVDNIEATTATGHGTIIDDGGETPSAWGVCVAETENPDTGDTVFAGSGAGEEAPFTVAMTSLTPEQHYFVRAYATNSEGTSYGSQVEFDAAAAPEVEGGAQYTRVSNMGILVIRG